MLSDAFRLPGAPIIPNTILSPSISPSKPSKLTKGMILDLFLVTCFVLLLDLRASETAV